MHGNPMVDGLNPKLCMFEFSTQRFTPEIGAHIKRGTEYMVETHVSAVSVIGVGRAWTGGIRRAVIFRHVYLGLILLRPPCKEAGIFGDVLVNTDGIFIRVSGSGGRCTEIVYQPARGGAGPIFALENFCRDRIPSTLPG